MKESLTVNSFCVILDRKENKNFASLYVGVPIAERIGLNSVNPLIKGKWTLADPWSVLGFELTGLQVYYRFLHRLQFYFLSFFKRLMALFLELII